MIISKTEKGYEYQTMRAYIDSYKHIQYLGTDKNGNICEKTFVYDWLDDAEIKCYDYITFKPPPLKVNSNEYNTWVETTDYYRNNATFFNDYSKNIVDNPIAIRQIYEGLMNRANNPIRKFSK
jgi:hypothetical protein